jgi:hypothetical protein
MVGSPYACMAHATRGVEVAYIVANTKAGQDSRMCMVDSVVGRAEYVVCKRMVAVMIAAS